MTTKPTSPTLPETSLTRLQEMATKLLLLGQATMQAYAKGELAHPLLLPLCEEIRQLEKQNVLRNEQTESTATPDTIKPVVPDSVAVSEPPPPEPQMMDPEMSFVTPLPTVVAQFTPPTPDPVITCHHCGAPLTAGRKFCTQCGASVIPTGTITPAPPDHLMTPPVTPLKCPSCHEAVAPDMLFCTNCGYQLQAAKSLEPMARPQIPTPPSLTPIITATTPQVVPPAPGLITQYCNNCGLGLPATMTVCPECGSRDIGA